MKPNPPDSPPPGDDAFLHELRRFALRPPPPAWKEEILAAARHRPAVSRPWHRSPFWRGVAALWGISIAFWADTQRLAPASPTASSAPPMDFSPASQPDIQSLLATLASENRRRPLLP